MIKKRAFNPRKEVWTEEVVEFFNKDDQKSAIADQVLTKLRRCLVPDNITIRGLFMVPANKTFKKTWEEVESVLIGAMLYHSDSLSDAKKFLAIEDDICNSYAQR